MLRRGLRRALTARRGAGDAYGSILVAGTRDCTLQRSYQKLVEEAPAPFLSDGQRSQLERCAAAICREAGYVNAGTVEFLLSPAGELFVP
jgi:acetyl-CoA/propionyl-CoA carboxylase biotin carboxyl carrier protein